MVAIINPEDEKRFNVISALEYLESRRFKVDKFLNERIRKVDQDFVLRELLKNPTSLAYIIKYNYELSEQQRIRMVVEKIMKEGSLTIMIGAKGYGKTATSVWLLNYIHQNYKKNLYWFGYNEGLEKHYPFVKQTYSLTKPEDNSFLVFDEASIALFAREFSTREQKEKIKQLPTLRHRNLALLIITQFSSSVDIDLFLLCDYVWFKPYFVSELDPRLNLPKWLQFCLPYNPNENLIYDMNKECIYTFKNPLPPYWNDELSKPFSKIKSRKEALKLLDKLQEAGFSEREIETILKLRGWEIEDLV